MRGAWLWILVLLLSGRSFAASAGGEPFDFLFLDANARPVALGGAYTALAADANALLYNPAGLAQVARHEATFMHNQYLQGISQEYAAFASPYGWGANLNFLSFGNVTKTTMSNPDGSGLGQTGLTDLAATLGYGLALTRSLSLGLGVKYIRETIDNTVGSVWAADVGALYAVPLLDGLTLGAALQNVGPTVRFQGAYENLPLNARAGAAYAFKINGQEQILSVDMSKERSQGLIPFAGVEIRLLAPLAMRVGYNGRNDAGIGVTAGFGVQWEDWSIDYAFAPMGDTGDAHRISATLRWGSGRAKPQPVQAAPTPVISTVTAASEQPQVVAASTAVPTALAIRVTTDTLTGRRIIESPCAVLPELPAPPTDKPARLLLRIPFTPDQSDISACDQAEIRRVADLLQASPQVKAAIEGHADNSGLEWWNQILSQSRADSVRNALVQNFAIAPSRLKLSGFGSTRPIDTNETVEGRAKNRRVEVVIEYGP